MSRETALTLQTNTLIGDGKAAWHQDLALQEQHGLEPNHYDGPIPVADVVRRLFDWDVLEFPVSATGTVNGQTVTIDDPTKKMLVRSDTLQPLSVRSDTWKVHPYKTWLLDGMSDILDDPDLHISAAGLLNQSRIAWVQVTWNEGIKSVNGVEFKPYFMAATALDGMMSSTYKEAMTLAVCDNTLDLALNEKGRTFRVRHTSNSELSAPKAREALGIMYDSSDAFSKALQAMTDEKVSEGKFLRWADAFVGLNEEKRTKGGRSLTIAENKRGQLINLWKNDERVAPWAGTKFGVLQTANTWAQHVEAGLGEDESRYDRNVQRFLYGKTHDLDKRALALLAAV